MGAGVGLKISTKPANLWHQRSSERTVERDLETIVQGYKKDKMKLQLILVVLPRKVGYEGISLVGKMLLGKKIQIYTVIF
jgi:hypothetical protein